MQQTLPDICPPPDELAEMSRRAAEVVRLLEEYRRLNLPESERARLGSAAPITPADDHRPPKRPWEELSQEDDVAGNETASFPEVIVNLLQHFRYLNEISIPTLGTKLRQLRNRIWRLLGQNVQQVLQAGLGLEDSRKANTGKEA